MKKVLLVVVVGLGLCASANADPILQLELGGTFGGGTPHVQGAPWDAFQDLIENPLSHTFGAYTVAAGGDRPIGSAGNTIGNFDIADVLRDGFTTASGDLFTLTISGLEFNTDYDFTFWHFQNLWGDLGAYSKEYFLQGVSLGSLPTGGTVPDSSDDYRSTFTTTSDGTGAIVFSFTNPSDLYVTQPYQTGYINGFQISEQAGVEIPEPATLLLVGTGALGAFGYIRRQRMK